MKLLISSRLESPGLGVNGRHVVPKQYSMKLVNTICTCFNIVIVIMRSTLLGQWVIFPAACLCTVLSLISDNISVLYVCSSVAVCLCHLCVIGIAVCLCYMYVISIAICLFYLCITL